MKPTTVLTVTQLGNLLGVRSEKGVLPMLLKRGIYNAARRAGYLAVPYFLPEYAEITGDALVTIIENGLEEELSSSFPDAHLFIELGMSIAMGNGYYENSEIRQLSYVMERNFAFSELDIRALQALKEMAVISPPDIERVTFMMSKRFSRDTCRKIARTMTTVGAAGSIGSGKIIVLRKLFAAVGIDERELYQLMMGCHYSEAGVIDVERIFSRKPERRELRFVTMIKLDPDVVADKKRETQSVGTILSEIFADGE